MQQSPTEKLETERLVLRTPRLEDADALFAAFCTDLEATRYLTWRPKQSVDEERQFLESALAARERGSEDHWVIETREHPQPVGMITTWFGEHGTELGYVLGREWWGMGFMTEAAAAIIDRALEKPDAYRVWAYCDCENLASVSVLEKVGMEREGVLRRWVIHPNVSEEPRDVFVYSLVR